MADARARPWLLEPIASLHILMYVHARNAQSPIRSHAGKMRRFFNPSVVKEGVYLCDTVGLVKAHGELPMQV